MSECVPTIRGIQQAVAAHYGMTSKDLASPCRQRPIAHARHVAMWIAYHAASRKVSTIGRVFGGRHHCTVIYAIAKVDEQMRTDEKTAFAVNALLAELKGCCNGAQA